MDKFYQQFFGKDEYPPDKKERPVSTQTDELDSTVDDGASIAGGKPKYEDLQSLNLGPPADGDVKKGAPLSPAPQYHSQKQQKAPLEPRETYIRADTGDGYINPKPDVPPPLPSMRDPAAEERFADTDRKERYPRITYYDKDPDDRRPRRRPDMPPGPRRDMSPGPRRDMSPGPRRRPDMPPGPRRDMSPGPRRDMSPGPRRDMSPGPRRDMSPGPRRDMSPGPRRDMPPGPRRNMSPGPRRYSPPGGFDEKRPYMGGHDEKRPYMHGPPGGPPGGPPRMRDRLQGVLSPYIGKWAKLSRVWTNQTVIMVLSMAVGYMVLAATAKRMAIDAAAMLLAGCGALDTAANHVINAPNTAALTMLGMLENTTRSIVSGTLKTLITIIDIFRDIIVWILRMYVGMYICFAELIIRTVLDMVSQASKLLTEELNKALDSVMGTLQNVASQITKGAQDAINGIAGLFGGNKNGPAVDFNPDDIRKQLNVQIPTDWTSSISSLADKIPTEDQIFGNITQVLDIPFAMIRNALTGALAGVTIDYTKGLHLPTDKKADVCDEPMGQDVILKLGDAAAMVMFWAGVAMIVAAIGMILFDAYMTVRRERKFRTRLVEFRHELINYRAPKTVREIEERPATRREMDMFVLPGQPWLDRFTRWMIKKFGDNERTTAWRWWLHYIWHPPAIACFIAGIIGLASIIVQIQFINGMRREYVPLLAMELTRFQTVVVEEKILAPVQNDSTTLANDVNGNILSTEGDLNRTLFGPVTDGTSMVNDTLNQFVATYIGGVRSVFGGTPLGTPIEGILNCTITKYIIGMQTVLGYVNEFASGVSLPLVSEDILTSGVVRLIGPLNATASDFREFAVGYYLPDADQLDPMSFREDEDPKLLLESLESKILARQSMSVDDNGNAVVDSNNGEQGAVGDDVPPEGGPEPGSGSGPSSDSSSEPSSEPSPESESAQPAPANRKRQAPARPSINPNNPPMEQIQPSADAPEPTSSSSTKQQEQVQPSAAQPSHSESEGTSGELGPLEDGSSSGSTNHRPGKAGPEEIDSETLFNVGPVPTADLTRQDIEDAQEFDGFTGGILGKLCDSYVSRLRGDIPLMIALILVWPTIWVVGAVHVIRDYSRIKKHNIR